MRLGILGCAFVVVIMILPVSFALAKGPGPPRPPDPPGDLYVYIHAYMGYDPNELTGDLVWHNSLGTEWGNIIVGLDEDDGNSAPGLDTCDYFQVLEPGELWAHWFMPDLPLMHEGDNWYVNVYYNAYHVYTGPDGHVISGAVVWATTVSNVKPLDKDYSLDAYCDIYQRYGSYPLCSLQWMDDGADPSTDLGQPTVTFSTYFSQTWGTKAGMGADGSIFFVDMAYGSSWAESDTVTAGFTLHYDTTISDGVMAGYKGVYKIYLRDYFGEELRFVAFPTEASKELAVGEFHQPIHPSYDEAKYQMEHGNQVGQAFTREWTPSDLEPRVYPAILAELDITYEMTQGWAVGGSIGAGLQLQSEISYSESSGLAFSRVVKLTEFPGWDKCVQTWTPLWLEDPDTGAIIPNSQHITFVYVAPYPN